MKITAISILLMCFQALANPDIEIVGLSRTSQSVVETEIRLCNCLDQPEKLRQQLLATGIIYDVQFETEGATTRILLKEKWTTIPIAKFSSGGGVSQYTIGVFDPNFLGQRIELGTQYENLSGAPSLVFWNRVPRLFESRFFSDIQVWNTQRARLKYDQDAEDATLTKAFLQKSEKLYFALGYEWDLDLRARVSFESQKDQFSTERLSSEVLNQVPGQVLPVGTSVYLMGFQMELGHLELIRQSPRGTQLNFQFKYGISQTKDVSDFTTSRVELLSYQHLNDWIWASRLQVGSTNTKVLQFWNYLGGFESIRGFVDNRFASRDYWLINQELRKFVYESEKAIVQAIGFSDFVGINEGQNELKNLHAASVGFGARLILPQFYRVVVRLDLSQTLLKTGEENVNFGIQQFF